MKTETIIGKEWFTYESEELENYLYDYKEMIGISGHDDKLIVQYFTTDDKSILLKYTDLGLEQTLVYDEKKDAMVDITTQEGTLFKNFGNQKIEGLED